MKSRVFCVCAIALAGCFSLRPPGESRDAAADQAGDVMDVRDAGDVSDGADAVLVADASDGPSDVDAVVDAADVASDVDVVVDAADAASDGVDVIDVSDVVDAQDTADVAIMDGADASDVSDAVDVSIVDVVDVSDASDAAETTDVVGDVLDVAIMDVSDAADVVGVMDASDAADVVADVGPSCTAPMTMCAAACVNTMTDAANCSTCGHACASGQICSGGLCCGSGLTSCGGVCTDLVSNPLHCGACGAVCAAGTSCTGGVCTPPRSCAVTGTPGCGFVAIPAGSFLMGDDTSSLGGTGGAGPLTLSGFTLDAYEVTVARFRRFWAAGHPTPLTASITYPGGSTEWGGSDPVVEPRTTATANCTWSESVASPSLEAHPINCVDWYTAQAFCVWDGGRLPTEGEWEYAARGWTPGGLASDRNYPWGPTDPTMSCDRAQWNDCLGDDGTATKRVGSFAPSGGLYDLAGNVNEWTADWYDAEGDSATDACWNGVSRTNPICNKRTAGCRDTRGGSWGDTTTPHLHSASDGCNAPMDRSIALGFRCVRAR